MLDLKENYKGKYSNVTCDLCRKENDTTEHLFKCEKLRRLAGQELPIACLNCPNMKLSNFLKLAMVIREYVELSWLEMGTDSNAQP